jgi:radical SAM protein with 4Fe4S-binding SPASM domain
MSLVKGRRIISKNEFLKRFNKGVPEKIRDKISYIPHKHCLSCEFFGKRCTGGCPLIKFELGPYA